MTDPMSDIENERAQRDIGVTGHRVYSGALEDGATRLNALLVTAAWFLAMFRNASVEEEKDD